MSMRTSLDGSMDGRREDVPDCRLESEVGDSRAEGRRKEVGLASSDARRDMVVAVQGEEGESKRERGRT